VACITGGIAEAFYGCVPHHIVDETIARLDDGLRSVVSDFMIRYCL
jgi:ADP-ribosylglycohydrolase